jgi:hypothetical protein
MPQKKTWVEYGKTWQEFLKDKPVIFSGVQIELTNGARFLIGDINSLGGQCDDCMAFSYDTVIERYRLLLTPQELQDLKKPG